MRSWSLQEGAVVVVLAGLVIAPGHEPEPRESYLAFFKVNTHVLAVATSTGVVAATPPGLGTTWTFTSFSV